MAAIICDGVAFCMAEDQYYATATTGADTRVYAGMSALNAQWGMSVDVANLTSAFCGMNISRPRAQEVLQSQESNIAFSIKGLPYLEGQTGHVAGVTTFDHVDAVMLLKGADADLFFDIAATGAVLATVQQGGVRV